MAEARQRSLKKAEILASAIRCVYCDHVGTYELEHMPPRGMFANKDRPSGWEFACCERCNKGTRGADALAIFMAQTEAITEDNWKLPNIIKLRGAIASHAPGVLDELFGMSKWDDSFINHNGILRPIKVGRVNGPLTTNYLNIFSAKAAMAAFMHFTKRPMELDGIIYTEWFLNGGMSEDTYKHIISIMPNHTQLSQGQKKSGKQFHVRYNTNNKNIVAAIMSFHNSLFVTIIATDGSEFIEPLGEVFKKIPRDSRPTINLTRPGLSELDRLASTPAHSPRV